MSIRNPSITYLITSTGRSTLKQTLRSLYGQFGFGLDKINLYFDGGFNISLEDFREEISMFGPDIAYTILDTNLGFWGHGIRNTYQGDSSTDYIHNMDDDDIYAQACVPVVRNNLRANYGKVLICKFRTDGGRIIWKQKQLIFGEIGTPSGFIFNRPDVLGTWKYEYGGDFSFYKEVEEKIGKENLVFSDTLVVKTKPDLYGY